MFDLNYNVLLTATMLAFCATPSAARADDTLRLSPASPWNVDYAEDKCRLIRKFGEGDDRVILHIEQTSREPFYNLAVFGEPVDTSSNRIIRITFGPDEGGTERGFLAGELKDADLPFILMHGIHLAPVPDGAKQGEFPVVDIGSERETAITELRLEKGIPDPIVLQLGPMNAPLEAMRLCVDDLVETLRLDPESISELASSPEPKNLHSLAREIQEYYPSRMLQKGIGGEVSVKMIVNRNGKPTSCQITQSDRPAAFDDYVCFGLMRNAEFEPATDADGQPQYGIWKTSVIYQTN